MIKGFGIGLAVGAAGVLAGCAQPAPSPTPQEAPAQRAVADLAPLVGRSYAEFAADPAMSLYSLDALHVAEPDQARFLEAMGQGQPARLLEGGGAEALVFYGCLGQGCRDAAAVLAVDAQTGQAFAGVRDSEGADELVPNDRLEALLRLNSTTRRWDDPAPSALDQGGRLP